MSGKSENFVKAVSAQSPIRLTWTHYSIILQESNKEARAWYEQEAVREMWGTRTLQRNVSSQYYHRLLQSQNKDAVRGEMKQLTACPDSRIIRIVISFFITLVCMFLT